MKNVTEQADWFRANPEFRAEVNEAILKFLGFKNKKGTWYDEDGKREYADTPEAWMMPDILWAVVEKVNGKHAQGTCIYGFCIQHDLVELKIYETKRLGPLAYEIQRDKAVTAFSSAGLEPLIFLLFKVAGLFCRAMVAAFPSLYDDNDEDDD